ncbi:MAG: DMT family transporter [Dictyoglomus sp.]|nr:DMT family transporter [Dictyoglomus sp.]MCX7942863.1 DMT family transporter [Dictyoglomaceae bacterium]MDW8189091.1 EamA family transporter [Dictyoglomus sp.]
MVWAYLSILGRIILLGYEKIVVKRLGTYNDSKVISFLFFFIAVFFLFPFIFLDSIPKNFEFSKYGLLSGFIYSISFILYVKSLSLGEASLVGPLYNFNVFFLLILTSIFLKESLTLPKILGLFLLVYGASYLEKKGSFLSSLKLLFKRKETLLMISSSFLVSVGRTIDGFVVEKVSPLFYCFFLYFIISIFQFFYILWEKKLKEIFRVLKENTNLVLIASAINAYSYLLLLFAFRYIDVSIAEPLSMLSMILTVILAHYIFKEKIGTRLLGVFIMILGSYILFLK